MNENDIIISICEYVGKYSANPTQTIDYAELDRELELPEGATQKHLEAAAADAGYEIKQKGDSKAMIVKLRLIG